MIQRCGQWESVEVRRRCTRWRPPQGVLLLTSWNCCRSCVSDTRLFGDMLSAVGERLSFSASTVRSGSLRSHHARYRGQCELGASAQPPSQEREGGHGGRKGSGAKASSTQLGLAGARGRTTWPERASVRNTWQQGRRAPCAPAVGSTWSRARRQGHIGLSNATVATKVGGT